MSIKVTPEQLLALGGTVGTGATHISGELSSLARTIAPLGSDWAGAAQVQFLELWAQWQTSAGQIQAALQGISALLHQAGAAYGEAERQIAATFATR